MEPAGPARVERRLAAILAADVAGYSRLIEAQEEGTLRRLKALRAEIVDPKLAGHKGRIVKTTGDGLLVEFASVVDALRCAAEMQAALAESNAPLPSDRRIEFRARQKRQHDGADAGEELDPRFVGAENGGADYRTDDQLRDRSKSGPTVPPQGLCMVQVMHDEAWRL